MGRVLITNYNNLCGLNVTGSQLGICLHGIFSLKTETTKGCLVLQVSVIDLSIKLKVTPLR